VIAQDRAEFTEAFVSAVRPAGPHGRPGWSMFLAAVSAVVAVALASLIVGATGGGASTAPAATMTVIAGPGCTSGAASFTKVGYQAAKARKPGGWTTSATGGYRGGGCAGAFVSLPLSGRANAYDTSRYALWTFALNGSTLRKKATCQLFTFVPGVTALSAVGAQAAGYLYYTGPYSAAAKPAGEYSVNQVKHRGSWVANSSFTVVGGAVAVKLTDAGATAGARAAAAQVRISCTAL
jgi:hypothetical protein